MSFYKAFIGSLTRAFVTGQKDSFSSDGNMIGAENDESRVQFLTKQFIKNDLALVKNKSECEVFSRHREHLITCLKRYEDAHLSQVKSLEQAQAVALLEALQQGKELSEEEGNIPEFDEQEYICGLKKVTLNYCQKHVLSMDAFMKDIPEHLCDGKNSSTAWQSVRNDASKKRWKNFDKACSEQSLYFSYGDLLFDTTLWGSAKNGFMLTGREITCLGGELEKFRIYWSDVKSLWHRKGYLYVNDYKTGFVADDNAQKLLELLEEHFDKVERSEGNLLLKYLGYSQTDQQTISNAYEKEISHFII